MREKSATSSPASGPPPVGPGCPEVIDRGTSRVGRGHRADMRPLTAAAVSPGRARAVNSGGRAGGTALDTTRSTPQRWPPSRGRPLYGRSSGSRPRRPGGDMTQPEPTPVPGRPVVLRGGTVLTMDDAGTVLTGADVLVVDDRIAGVGAALEVPEGTQEIDARGGIVMPGMIDTHRHMWQTAMRGYGADWTLTQYFVWYYLEHGKKFRPQDIAAGNRLAAIESLDAGVTTTVDWSHGLKSVDHAEAAVDAMRSVPGRFVLAYGNIHAGPWEWTADPAVRSFLERLRDARDDLMGVQIAFDVTGDPAFPEKAAFEAARELGIPVTTHAGVWGATSDTGIQQMYDNGFMTPETTYVHASTLTRDSYQRIAATGGSISVATESECSAGQGHAPTEQVLQYGIPVSLSMDTSVWWSGDMFSAMRATLNADRMAEHMDAHLKG